MTLSKRLKTSNAYHYGSFYWNIRIKPNFVFLIIGKPVNLETSRLMGRVKSNSSLNLRREFPELVERTTKALWAVKYRIID
jgi:REP element-mobilizing transposase RayT